MNGLCIKQNQGLKTLRRIPTNLPFTPPTQGYQWRPVVCAGGKPCCWEEEIREQEFHLQATN